MEEEESWISSFCNVVGHEYFAEVLEEFIEDDFNLTGLSSAVTMYTPPPLAPPARKFYRERRTGVTAHRRGGRYKEALEMILDVEPEDDSDSLASDDDDLSDPGARYRPRTHQRSASDYSIIESSAELLYGLIHARFITSRQGLQVMYEKYLANHFGFCPRVSCASARVLPCGYSDTPGAETVKLFCPSCCDIYVPPNSRFQAVDGAYFGTTFPSLFLMTFPELDVSGNGKREITVSSSLNSQGGKRGQQGGQAMVNGVLAGNVAPGLGKGKRYEPRIYGFRVNERARSGPRMQWLRDKPEDLGELDEMARFGRTGEGDEDESEIDSEDEEGSEEEDGGEVGGKKSRGVKA